MSALRKHDIHTPAEQTEDGPQHALSAMLDGEASGAETEACLTAMKHDDGLRQQWSDYHLIGDLMRGAAPLPSGDFAARFSARLATEPTVLAPHRRVWPQRVAVASLASFAVWGVVALTGLMSGAPGPAPMAVGPAFRHAAVDSTPAGGDARFAAYVGAHQEFAPLAVASPYQRVTANVEEPR